MGIISAVSLAATQEPSWLGVDWGAVTGLATAVLAVGIIVTLWGVWEARNAAKAELVTTQAQLRATYRPLLIEVLREGPVTPDMGAKENPTIQHRAVLPWVASVTIGVTGPTVSIDPRTVYVDLAEGWVSVPLRNVGRGLAVVHEIGARVDHLPFDELETTVTRPRVPPGETTRVNFRVSDAPEYRRSLAIRVPYTDLAYEQMEDVHVRLTLSPDGDHWEVAAMVHVDRTGDETFFGSKAASVGRLTRLKAQIRWLKSHAR